MRKLIMLVCILGLLSIGIPSFADELTVVIIPGSELDIVEGYHVESGFVCFVTINKLERSIVKYSCYNDHKLDSSQKEYLEGYIRSTIKHVWEFGQQGRRL